MRYRSRVLGVKPAAIALYKSIILDRVVFRVLNIDEITKARGEDVGAYYNA